MRQLRHRDALPEPLLVLLVGLRRVFPRRRLIGVIPGVGPDLQPWLPFVAAENFLAIGHPALDGQHPPPVPYPPWLGLAYAAATAAVLLTVAITTTRRRNA